MSGLRNKQGLTEQEFLAKYDPARYPRPSVTVDVMALVLPDANLDKRMQVLLIRRGDHPCIGQWALPGGFVDMAESLEGAAARELEEETGLTNLNLEQLHTFGDPGRDPRTRIISTVYLALLAGPCPPARAGDDAAQAQWFRVEQQRLREQVSGDSAAVESLDRLVLRGEDVKLEAEIKITRRLHGNKMTVVSREIVQSGGIAFDHAKILHLGLERAQFRYTS